MENHYNDGTSHVKYVSLIWLLTVQNEKGIKVRQKSFNS